MSATGRRRLRTRIIEWFVVPDPDPQPSRLDLDDHPASRENTGISPDPGSHPRTLAADSRPPSTRLGTPGATSVGPAAQTPVHPASRPREGA